MSMIEAASGDASREGRVVSKAVARAAHHLALPNKLLAEILGISEASVSRLKAGRYVLPPGGKPYELALLFVRLFRGLDAIMAGDDAASCSWLRSDNVALRGRPIDLIRTITGLSGTVAYVDSRRARL